MARDFTYIALRWSGTSTAASPLIVPFNGLIVGVDWAAGMASSIHAQSFTGAVAPQALSAAQLADPTGLTVWSMVYGITAVLAGTTSVGLQSAVAKFTPVNDEVKQGQTIYLSGVANTSAQLLAIISFQAF